MIYKKGKMIVKPLVFNPVTPFLPVGAEVLGSESICKNRFQAGGKH